MSAPAAESGGQTESKSSFSTDNDLPETKEVENREETANDGLTALHKVTSLTRGTFARTALSVPTRVHRTSSSDTLSLISAEDFSELRLAQPPVDNAETTSPTTPLPGWRGKVYAYWLKQKGLVLVMVAQLFGTLMNVTTRLLEEQGEGMHPFQIIFTRMFITCFLSSMYMWYQKIPDFPLGAKSVRGILVARGVGGFFGVFGLYWSLQYLPLSDATVLTFIAPMFSCWICSKLLKEPFTRIEQVGALISLAGVFLIARPTAIFTSSGVGPASQATPGATPQPRSPTNSTSPSTPTATPHERLAAVGMSMIGVLGASTAYITIRWIGKRAHSLISVNYFAAWCTIVSAAALAFVPSIPFVLPSTARQWLLLLFIGVSGFVMQFLMTAGLRYEKSSRATNMVYTQMLFAVGFDKLIWGTTPGLMSVVGGGLILGSAIVVAVQREGVVVGKKVGEEEVNVRGSTDEETGLVQGEGRTGEEGDAAEQETGSVENSARSSMEAEGLNEKEEEKPSVLQRIKKFVRFGS